MFASTSDRKIEGVKFLIDNGCRNYAKAREGALNRAEGWIVIFQLKRKEIDLNEDTGDGQQTQNKEKVNRNVDRAGRGVSITRKGGQGERTLKTGVGLCANKSGSKSGAEARNREQESRKYFRERNQAQIANGQANSR
jgi:hypothetical protein